MTQVDPFAATAAATSNDPFLDPTRGGNFPKPAELLHKLLIMVPVEVTKVPKRNSKTGEMQDRWSINTTVIDTDGSAETFDEMFWSHTSIVKAAAKAFREKRPMLGTLHLFPVDTTKDKLPTEDKLLADEDIQRWISRGGAGLPPFPVAWALEPATAPQREVALKWWNENMNPFGN